jgi:hypothetical protein
MGSNFNIAGSLEEYCDNEVYLVYCSLNFKDRPGYPRYE